MKSEKQRTTNKTTTGTDVKCCLSYHRQSTINSQLNSTQPNKPHQKHTIKNPSSNRPNTYPYSSTYTHQLLIVSTNERTNDYDVKRRPRRCRLLLLLRVIMVLEEEEEEEEEEEVLVPPPLPPPTSLSLRPPSSLLMS